MAINSEVSNASRRRFLTVAGAAATCYIVVGKASSAEAARTHPRTKPDFVVTIDVTKNPIAYTLADSSDASELHVSAGKVVTWKSITPGSKHHLALVFYPDTPFIDKNNNPVFAFHGSESDEGNGIGINASIDPNASGWYDYCVAVWDESKSRTYTDDPTIMIGDGKLTTKAARAKLIAVEKELKKVAQYYPPASEQLKSIGTELQNIIHELK
jgi:hypothetical protein